MQGNKIYKKLTTILTCAALVATMIVPGVAEARVKVKDLILNLAAVAEEGPQVSLQWTLSDSASISGYKIERSLDPLAGYSVIHTATRSSTRSYVDQSVEAGQAYYYKVRAYKRSSYSAYSNVEFADIPADEPQVPVDNPPTVVFTSPAEGTVYDTDSRITVIADAQDDVGISKVEFFSNGSLVKVDSSVPYSINMDVTEANNGSYAFTAKAYDTAGQAATTSTLNVVVDISPVPVDAPPSVVITSPANGTVYDTDSSIIVTADAQDDIGISKVEFFSNGTLVNTDSTAPYSFNMNVTEANNGSYAFTAKAFDTAGQVATSSATNVVVDITSAPVDAPPTIGFSSPANGAVYDTESRVTVIADAQDDAGISKVEFFKDGVRVKTDSSVPYSYNWDVVEADNGSYSFTAKAFDTAGQVTTSSALNVVVDINSVPVDTPPTVVFSSPANGAVYDTESRVTVIADAQDDTGISKVEFFRNGLLVKSDSSVPYSYNWDVVEADNGSYSFTAKAYDTAGQITTSSALSVVVDINPAPAPAEYTGAVLESVVADGYDFILSWSQPESAYGTPDGGYDIFIDGVDTDAEHRTTALSATVSGLAAGQHCFQIQTRWVAAGVWPVSETICAISDGGTEEPTDPPTNPPPTGNGVSLRINPDFSRNQLPADARVWYDRLWNGINNPQQIINLTDLATSNDTFKYGRQLNAHVSSLLHVLQVTGDPALLDEIDRLTELMRAQLQDRSILTYNGTNYESDGYLNWQYFYDAGYHGTDIHQMDEILAHSFVASFAYAFHVNRDLDPRFAERADFWTDYLKNHFEAKWRDRRNKPTGNFLEKDLAHPYTQWIRYHYYMYQLTGEVEYLNIAEQRANVVDRLMTDVNGGSAVVWDHRVTEVKGASSWGCQPFYYGRQTVMAAIDLTLQGFSIFNDALVTKMAGTVRDNIIDNGATDFAPDICGGTPMGGLSASGFSRETQGRWSDTAGYQEIGAWDTTGTIMNISNQVHNDIEGDPSNPRYILNASGVVFSMLYN